MDHHYRTFATYEEFGDIAKLRVEPPSRHAMRFLKLVADLGLAPGRAYEVGCASGAMLHQFRRTGWQVGGCDPSPSAVSQAADIFSIPVDLGGEETALARQENLDLILACHVLEHLYDPAATLSRCHAALGAGGHLVLEVPCATAPDLLPPGWFTFEHLHYYQPELLERLLRLTGFEVVDIRIESSVQHYPVMAMAARKSLSPAEEHNSFDPAPGMLLAQSYAARDGASWTVMAARLMKIQEPLFLYGAGIHTAQLLDHADLAARVIAIADRDSKKWGQTLAGRPVISPQQLFAWPSQAPVIVSSYVSEKQIVAALLNGGIAASRIVPLYSKAPVDAIRATG